MDAFLTDLKQAVRTFLRTPGFTIAAIAALALGIGTSTAIVSVVNTT
jgi:putative ABC transport system permease protein